MARLADRSAAKAIRLWAAISSATAKQVPSRGLKDRFQFLTSGFDAKRWHLLGAIAAEESLGQRSLEKLSHDFEPSPRAAALTAGFLEVASAAGLLVPARPPGLAVPSALGAREAWFQVEPEYRQLVLRRLAKSGELEAACARTRALLRIHSKSELTQALQTGAFEEFQRRFALKTPVLGHALAPRAEWLRASIGEPFDAEWLERTWGDDTLRVATLVLHEGLYAASDCDALYTWLAGQRRFLNEPDDALTPATVLYQHAILRGAIDGVGALVPLVPGRTALALSAAIRFLEGNLPDAQTRLDEALGFSSGKAPRRRASGAYAGPIPECAATAPLLALILCARDTDQGRTAAKRMLTAGSSEKTRGPSRALKTLLRYLSEAEAEHRRLDVHQLDPGAGVWETLILALTVHLHLRDPWIRAAWCQHLVRRALRWQKFGYSWLARQTLWLASALSEEYFARELESQGQDLSSVPRLRSKELVLWELIAPKPEWKKALEALSKVSEGVEDELPRGYRVLWFVDMASGTLSQPGLQQFLASEGWTEGRRLTLAELWEHRLELPNEDLRVLESTREVPDGSREFTKDALEALIDHPRVVNGARGRARVEVVRGRCRVETEEDAGFVRVVVEPARAELGVNVVPEGENRLVVYRVTPAMKRVIQALPRGARIPKAHERELLSVLGKLAESVEVRSPQLGSERTVAADATPCLQFAAHAGAWLVQLGVRPFGEKGRFFLAGVGRESLAFYSDGQRLRCERDFEAERSNVNALRAACPTLERPDDQERGPLEPEDSWVLGEQAVLELLAELRDSSAACALEWPENGGMRLKGRATRKSFHGRLRSEKGWYLATGGVRLDDITELALSELVRAPAVGNGRFLRLENGDFIEVEARIRRVIAALKAVTPPKLRGTELRVPRAALSTLSRLGEAESGFELDSTSSAWLERVARLSNQAFEVPSELRAVLRPYQVEGYRWLAYLSELGLGACLADDMGLGKTIQILALLLTRTQEGPALVVAPTSVCANWVQEIKKFAPTLTALDYMGKDRAGALQRLAAASPGSTVVISSYGLLQQDRELLGKVGWGTLVLDEAQFIKNPESLRAKAAFSLSAKMRVAATGTPVENHFGDLWSIFHFLSPGLLGDFAQFNQRFVLPAQREGTTESTETLRQLIRPFILRRSKSDVLSELPPITEVRHDVQLSEGEALRYAVLRKQIHEKLYTSYGKRENKLEVLAEIMRLRRFCCHPALVFPDAPKECSKVDAFLELVEELRENGHRALVFSQFVDFLGLVRHELDERGIRYEYLDGSTPQAVRPTRVEAFQHGNASLFLISLKAGGFGLNLTAADYVIHLDPWWNPAVEAQATDRAHRIGQERPVTVYRLVTRNTIEESIVNLHAKKRKLAESLLEGGEVAGKLSAQELVLLIGAASE